MTFENLQNVKTIHNAGWNLGISKCEVYLHFEALLLSLSIPRTDSSSECCYQVDHVGLIQLLFPKYRKQTGDLCRSLGCQTVLHLQFVLLDAFSGFHFQQVNAYTCPMQKSSFIWVQCNWIIFLGKYLTSNSLHFSFKPLRSLFRVSISIANFRSFSVGSAGAAFLSSATVARCLVELKWLTGA